MGIPLHEEDEPERSEEPLSIIICMTKESSRWLLDAQYLLSDIGFKRIIDFYEFELMGHYFDSHTSTMCLQNFSLISTLTLYFTGFPYSHVYLNCQTAAAHQLILEKIQAIVFEDTGELIQW